MKANFSEEKAKENLEKGYDKAEELLKDPDKVEAILQRLEQKLNRFKIGGEQLATVIVFISLVRSYIKNEYRDIPVGSILAIISALIYVLAPADAIPDVIPVLGQVDDAAIVVLCYKLVKSDVDDYKKWRKDIGKELYEEDNLE